MKLRNYVSAPCIYFEFYLPFNNDPKKIKSYRSEFNFLSRDLINIAPACLGLGVYIHGEMFMYAYDLIHIFSQRLSPKSFMLCMGISFIYAYVLMWNGWERIVWIRDGGGGLGGGRWRLSGAKHEKLWKNEKSDSLKTLCFTHPTCYGWGKFILIE